MSPLFIRFDGKLINIAKVSCISTFDNWLYITFERKDSIKIEYADETDCVNRYNHIKNLLLTNGLILY